MTDTKKAVPQPMLQAGETHEHYMARVREWQAAGGVVTQAQAEHEQMADALKKDEERSGTQS